MRAPDSRAIMDSLRDAAIAAGIAAVLALPCLASGFSDSAQGGAPEYRLLWVVYAAVAVFFGHLAITHGRALLGQVSFAQLRPDAPRPWVEPLLLVAMIAFAIALPLFPFAERNLVDRATLILIYVLLATGLNIVVGSARLARSRLRRVLRGRRIFLCAADAGSGPYVLDGDARRRDCSPRSSA
jgi:branched-chain amino acid transport system permease protein